jgi:DNA end-binding protein Ku
MRSNWKGMISFGLVSIPIVLYPAVNKSADISFHQIDRRDNSRIKYQRVNATTGREVKWDDITRGYEYDKETTIPVPDDVLKKVAGENAHSIDIETFIDKKDLDFLTYERSYYLVPDKKGDKGYVILRESLRESNKIGIAKVIISTKEYIAAVIPHNKALILCLLKYANEMRSASDFDLPTKELTAYKISKKEIDIAKQLIQAMTAKWRPADYVDEYQEAIHKWVEETVNKKPHSSMTKRSKAPSNVVNFVDLLKKSLATENKTARKTKTKSKTSAKKPPVKTRARVARQATRH